VSIEMAIPELVESGIGSAPHTADDFDIPGDSWLIELAEHGRFIFGCHRNKK
jgi:hypothetical protein